MSNIIFARTRYVYQSYTDYWSLVSLSGFPTCYVDEINLDSDDLYIISPMNGEWRPYVESKLSHSDRMRHNHKAKLVLWNLERPGGSGGISNYVHENLDLIDNGYIDRVVVSDMSLAHTCKLEYMPMGSHAGLGQVGNKEAKRYDLIHLSCYSNNRSWLFSDPSHPRTDICGHTVAPNGWGEERHNNLIATRFMLSVHQDEFPYIEPLRFALASAYGLPILAEFHYQHNLYTSIVSFNRNDFCRVLRISMTMYDYLYAAGIENHLLLTGINNFRNCIERML